MIKIMSRNRAIQFISINPDYPIIAIGETFGNDVERLTSVANNCLCLKFDDIEVKRGGNEMQMNQLQSALEWAKDHPNLIVACRAGISRSSAIAYLIECTRNGPEEAIKILNMDLHQPNRLVIEMGTKLLESEEITNVHDRWLGEVYQRLL